MKTYSHNVSDISNRYALHTEKFEGNGTEMGWFQAFRGDFGFSHYGEYRTSVTADIPYAAIIYTCVLVSIAALIAAAGIRGKERWYTLARMVYSLAVGSVILVSIFGYCWQTGEVGVHSTYIYRRESYMEGTVGVRIGLKTVNLTLTGRLLDQKSHFRYNEELVLLDVIHWPPLLWHALDRGLPQPLLTVLEHFDVDDGGIRYGRSCWMAGYFATILLWSAFALWVTGNVLLCSVVWYGAACFTLTGVCMTAAATLYSLFCPQADLRMPCSDGLLKLRYGWCFYSTLVFGILTILVGLVLFAMDQKVPRKLAQFLLLDLPDDDSDEPRGSTQVFTVLPPGHEKQHANMFHGSAMSGSGTPVKWYVNFASEPITKGNPLYNDGETEEPASYDVPRARAYSDILEEAEQRDSLATPQLARDVDTERHVEAERDAPNLSRHGDVEGHEDAERHASALAQRLSEVYVDVEPTVATSLSASDLHIHRVALHNNAVQ